MTTISQGLDSTRIDTTPSSPPAVESCCFGQSDTVVTLGAFARRASMSDVLRQLETISLPCPSVESKWSHKFCAFSLYFCTKFLSISLLSLPSLVLKLLVDEAHSSLSVGLHHNFHSFSRRAHALHVHAMRPHAILLVVAIAAQASPIVLPHHNQSPSIRSESIFPRRARTP